jgi:aspartyl-tRNA(Asn)/glutamyl-tRNA(Gln) amidotransferase subunit A
MSELLQRPLTEIADALRAKTLSPVELMQATLDRIDATHKRLNAFVTLREREALLTEAKEAEARITRGDARAIEGVPLGVKDLEDVAGLVTSMGSVPFKDNVAQRDSVQVERLRAAGAIVVGKTNAPEFGYTAITKNLLFGASRNPWNPDHSPGGSSGGTSAAIAGGVIALGTASDGGGSVRLPAAFVGAFGLKPSYGRIPHEGPLWTMDDTAVHGPLTRTVEDAALHLDLTVGPHPFDPNSLPHPGVSYRGLLEDLPERLRIGYSPDLGYAVVRSDVADVCEDAARVFAALGHTLEPIAGGPPDLGRSWGILGAFEMYGKLAAKLPEHEADFGRGFLQGTQAGAAAMTAERYGKIREGREQLNRWCADVFDQVDLLVTPTIPYDAPPAKGPFPSETEGRKQPPAGVAAFTIPFNLSWHPAATVRAGMSENGLPLGLQIVGPRHRDDLVLQAARAFERERPWAQDWPQVP